LHLQFVGVEGRFSENGLRLLRASQRFRRSSLHERDFGTVMKAVDPFKGELRGLGQFSQPLLEECLGTGNFFVPR